MRLKALSSLILAALLALPVAAYTQNDNNGRREETPRSQQPPPRERPPPPPPVQCGQAASMAQRATGGRVLNVIPERDSCRVRVLMDDGRARDVRVDPRTGRVR